MIWRYLVEGPWIVFVTFWVAGALRTRRVITRENSASRYLTLSLEILGFALIFLDVANLGVLGRQVVRWRYAQGVAGVALTWMGISLALWARWHLGQYWSARVTLKEAHQLIRTGPYAHFRHPIYSGIDLAAIGGALAIDRWRCVLGLVFLVLGYGIKARREEALLAKQFGAAFTEHCRHTGFLIPKFR